jgi:hypothetical protein
MPETSSQPATPMTAGSSAPLRIVLFGMPDAGKSSLLGALAQAAQTQEHVLNGRLIDRSQGLAELQQRLYEERPRETLEEVVPYPVTFEIFAPGGDRVEREAILYDCDGRVANDLLSRQGDFNADGALAGAILQADTLVLAVDASAGSAVLDRDFDQFGHFLHLLEQRRGLRSDVGGLPVYLVLTKCDLLAQKNDTSVAWMDRIEERKRQVGARFQDFLSQQAERGPLSFGQIELHLWATAVKRPALADLPAKPREPYGVAELFRQGLDSAQGFHDRRLQAGRRLNYTVGLAAGVMGLMVLLSLLLFFGRQEASVTALEREIRDFRAAEAEAGPSRYKDPTEEIHKLEQFKRDPEKFNALSPELREFVDSKLAELRAYREFKNQVDQVLDDHGDFDSLRNLIELKKLRDDLAKLSVPPKYEQEWKQTEAVRRRQEALADGRRLQDAVEGEMAWYRSRVQEGNKLVKDGAVFVENTDKPNQRDKWLQDSQNFLEKKPRHAADDRIPGSARLTYALVLAFDEVDRAVAEYAKVKKRLDGVRQLVLNQ